MDVLIVDDSKVMRDMLTACLRSRPDLAVSHAATGLEAIEQLSLGHFDILMLDLNMPDVGGLEVIEFVRSQDRLRALPILVISSRGDEESRTGAMAAGASGYLTKPFAPETVLREVTGLLGLT